MLSTSTLALGAVAIAVAAMLRFVLVPANLQLPEDTQAHRTFVGTIGVMLDQDAWDSGDYANMLRTDIPVVLEADVAVSSVDGGIAHVVQDVTITSTDGEEISATTDTYAVDRRSMQGVGDREGLVMGWPIGPDPVDVQVWSTDLQAPVEAAFTGTEVHAGLTTHRFDADVRGPIVDPVVVEQMPTSIPRDQIPAILAAIDLPASVTEGLDGFLAEAPDEIPLSLTADLELTWWVDPVTGDVIDVARTERRLVGVDLEGVPNLSFADAFSMTYVGEEASVAAAVADARANGSALKLWSTRIPVALALVGVGLLLVGVRLRRRRPEDPFLVLPESIDRLRAAGV